MKVDFGGCGKGGAWITVNIDGVGAAHQPPDIVADITAEAGQLDEYFAPESIDEAQCVAVFEHLPAHDLVPTLTYWRTFLKPGAKITIMVPHMRKLAEDWIAGIIDAKTYMDCVFSPPEWTRKALGEVHRYGFSEGLLFDMLYKAGFRNCAVDKTHHPDMIFYVGDYLVPNLTVAAWK